MTTTEFDLVAYKTAQQRDWTTTTQGWQQFHAVSERQWWQVSHGLHERAPLCAFGSVALLVRVAAAPAGAGPLTVTAPKSISIATPFAPGCGGATEGSVPGANFNYPNSETEPWLAVSPTNPNDVAGFWQQDRWSDGGSHGLVAAVSHDGGASFA